MRTQPSFQVVIALAVPVGNLKPIVLIGYPSGQDRLILLPWDCPTNKLVHFRQCWWWSRKKWQNVIKTKEVKTAVVCSLCCKYSWLPSPPLEINELFLIFSRPKVVAKKMWSPLSMGALDKFWILFVSLWVVTNKFIIYKSTHLLFYLFL